METRVAEKFWTSAKKAEMYLQPRVEQSSRIDRDSERVNMDRVEGKHSGT